MATKPKGLILEIGADTTALQQALTNANKTTTSLSKELREVDKLLKLNPSSVQMVSQQEELLQQQIKNTSTKLEELKKHQKDVDDEITSGVKKDEASYRELEREIEKTTQQLKDLQLKSSSIYQIGDSFEKFGEKISNASNKIADLGQKMSVVSLPILAIGGYAVKSAVDFESAWIGVTKTVDGTDEQLNKLKNDIIKLSEEIPSSAIEIANVAEIAGQLGIATDDVINFTKVMIDLGNSTNLNAEEAASSLAKFANVTKMSANDYEKLGSTIVDLGNNFATTEADIVNMATRLGAVGDLAGLSQAQILALATSMSSVGVEAEAGGSAMGKLLKIIQTSVETNSKNLKDFASVAGMTTKEFKKAFEEDAAGALQKFISGLNDTERNGKSAIQILKDMDLNEVRLSTTILSLASASDLMGDALTTANNAWNSNTALANEANKRYESTASQLEIVKNKANNMAMEFGNTMLPIIEKVIDKLTGLVDWFSNLSDSEKENIIKIGALVAALGPVLTIVGKLGSVLGTSIKGIGLFSQAIGVLATGGKSASGAVNTLSTVIGAITSPAGLAVTAIAAVTAAYVAMSKKIEAEIDEQYSEQRNLIQSIADTAEARKKEYEAINESMSSQLAEVDVTKHLKDELDKIVDSNGKVKEGYESRAKYITGELSKAIGIEIDLVDGQIKKYSELSNSIDNAILKKKAEIIMNSYDEKYAKASEDRTNAVKDLNEALEKEKKVRKDIENTIEELADALSSVYTYDNTIVASKLMKELEELNKEQETLTSSIKTNDAVIKEQTQALKDYDEALDLMADGSTESLNKLVSSAESATKATSKAAEDTTNSLYKRLKAQMEVVKENSKVLDTIRLYGEDTILESERQNEILAKQNLSALVKELSETTSTIEGLSKEQVEAWKYLAEQDYTAYAEGLSMLDDETSATIQRIVGIFHNSKDDVNKVSKDLADTVVNNLGKNAEADKKAVETLQGYLRGLSDSKQRELLKQAGVDNVDVVIKELNSAKGLSQESGINILKGLQNGLNNSGIRNNILTSAVTLASKVTSAFNSTWDIGSPSKVMKEMMAWYLKPIESSLSNNQKYENMASKFASGINESVMEGFSDNGLSSALDGSVMTTSKSYNIVMNINPQQLSDAELNNAFNYVNKKLGTIGG